MSVFVAMLAATIGVCLTPVLGFMLAFPILFPIGLVVRKISPWDEDDDFHPRNRFFISAHFGTACAICVSGALVYANYVASNRMPAWPVAVVPGGVAFAGAFLAPLVPHPRAGLIPLIAAAILAIPVAGIAAHVWG